MYFLFELGDAFSSNRACTAHFTEHLPRFLGMTVFPLAATALVLNKGWWPANWGDPSHMWVVTTVLENTYVVLYNVIEYPCSDQVLDGYKLLDDDIFALRQCANITQVAGSSLVLTATSSTSSSASADGVCEVMDLRSRYETLHHFIFIISLASMLAGNVLWNPPFKVYMVGVILDVCIVLSSLAYEFKVGKEGHGGHMISVPNRSRFRFLFFFFHSCSCSCSCSCSFILLVLLSLSCV